MEVAQTPLQLTQEHQEGRMTGISDKCIIHFIEIN